MGHGHGSQNVFVYTFISNAYLIHESLFAQKFRQKNKEKQRFCTILY